MINLVELFCVQFTSLSILEPDLPAQQRLHEQNTFGAAGNGHWSQGSDT